ncbi:MAG TPA: hypothetical protein PK020_00110 [Ilumatobacteraceae bacterium]|nr:hypothetical protein [Ilumatobacteraceae bacterium]HRB01750.1 hypothetical protein [Ilumatobacteraceae bacterium]
MTTESVADSTPPETAAPTTVAPTTTSTPTTTAPTTTVAAAPTTAPTCVADGDADPKLSADTLTISPLFGTDIAAAAASCTETITIRFGGKLEDPTGFPGWDVQYVDDPAPTVGAAVLRITVGAMMPNTAGEGYTGPTEILPTGTAHILKMTQTANADGSSTWAVELDAVYPFDVVAPDGPARIVIALQTGA